MSQALCTPGIIILDTGVLGQVSHPDAEAQNTDCWRWLRGKALTHKIIIPEIADYELRREYLRRNNARGIHILDDLADHFGYLPLSTATMRCAARFWAKARQQGRPTVDPHALDADVILAAQARELANLGYLVIVATTNVGHLSAFVDARCWDAI